MCSSSVRVVDVKSGRKRKLEAQFSGGIVAMSFTQCGRYLAVAGSGSREVLLFDIQAGAEATPLVAVAVLGEPKSLLVRSVASEKGDRIEVLCVFEDADACFIRYAIQGASETIRTTTCNITTGSNIMAGRFGNSTGAKIQTEITLALGQKSSPSFSSVTIADAEGNLSENVEVHVKSASSSSSEVISSAESLALEGAKRSVLAPVVLGPHESGPKKRPQLSDDLDSSKKRQKKFGLDDLDELTLEQRLDSLSNSLVEVEKMTDVPVAVSSAQAAGEDGPSSNSLVVIIEQALQSGDDALLEQSLACDDVSIIEATSKRLPPGRVVQLLRKLVAKFEKRPSRGLLLTRWLAAVLRFHTSFLISVPDLSAQLAGLSQMLEQRLSSYTKLAALGGRLDLLMSQITTITEANGNGKRTANQEASIPRQVYRE
jgi:Dip2/Utp12 Family